MEPREDPLRVEQGLGKDTRIQQETLEVPAARRGKP